MDLIIGVFAILFGYGILTITYAILPRLFREGPRKSFTQQEYGGSQKDPRFQTETLKGKLESLLYQAGADISLPEFFLTSMIIGGSIGAVFLIATQALIISSAAFLLGFVLYFVFLWSRWENNALEYEKVQPQVVSAMYLAFKTKGNNLDGVLNLVAENGPTIVRDDWKIIRSSMTGTQIEIDRINQLLNRRASPALTTIVDILITYRDRVNDIPEILDSIREDIAQDVEDTTTALSALKGPRQEMGIVALVPIVIVLFYITSGMGAYYSTVSGQLLIVAAWVFTGIVYWYVNRMVRKAVNPRMTTFTIPESRSLTDRTFFEPDRASGSPGGLR